MESAIRMGCWRLIQELDIIAYLYLYAKQKYYQGEPVISDARFDSFEDTFRSVYPDHPALQVVGLIYSKCQCCKD